MTAARRRQARAALALAVAAGGCGHAPAKRPPTTVPAVDTTHRSFRSPSGNIQCEVDAGAAGVTVMAYCQTGSPARSVTMWATGTLTRCSGVRCLGNAPEDQTTLAYDESTAVGPFAAVR